MEKFNKKSGWWLVSFRLTLLTKANLKTSLLAVFSLLTLTACVSECDLMLFDDLNSALDNSKKDSILIENEASDKKENLKSGEAAAFISVWKVEDSDKTIELPLVETDANNVGMYDFQVNWGDETSDLITTWDSAKKSHTYEKAGKYTVTIAGSIVGWRFGNGKMDARNPHAKKLTEVKQWGNLFLGKTQGHQFFGAENLNITATDAPLLSTDDLNVALNRSSSNASFSQNPNLVKTADLNHAFAYATRLRGNLDWDFSQVASMEGLFKEAKNFNQDIGSWNVGNVTNMKNMFRQSFKFDQDIGDWNVANVTDMSATFFEAKNFNQDIGSWNVGNVTDMKNMFRQSSKFNQDIGDWNVANVTDMSATFFEAKNFNQDIGSWNVGNVTSMRYMFGLTSLFNQDIGAWNVEKVADMEMMFYYGEAFNQDISSWNVEKVSNMRAMFFTAINFNQDVSRWKIDNVTNMSYMFWFAESFNKNISNWSVKGAGACKGFSRGTTIEKNPNYQPNFTLCNPLIY